MDFFGECLQCSGKRANTVVLMRGGPGKHGAKIPWIKVNEKELPLQQSMGERYAKLGFLKGRDFLNSGGIIFSVATKPQPLDSP